MGNGFGSDSGITGAVNSSSGTSFDLNDFPSLGGGVGVGVGIGAGHGLAAALREQQQILANQQMLQGGNNAGSKGGSNPYMLAIAGTNGNFQIANEDFPALGGGRSQSSTSGLGNGSGLNVTSLLSNNVTLQSDTSMLENGLYGGSLDSGISHLDGGAGLLGGTGLGGLGSLRNTSASQQQPAPSGAASVGAIGSSTVVASASATGNALSGDYGLLGLLGVIRMTDADRNALALGSDLQLLGLNLGTAEQIYGTFASPWSESATSKEPHFQVSSDCFCLTQARVSTRFLSPLIILFFCFSSQCAIICNHQR